MAAVDQRLRAALKYSKGKKQPWWVRISYPNGRIHSKTENYTRKCDAENARDALLRGFVFTT